MNQLETRTWRLSRIFAMLAMLTLHIAVNHFIPFLHDIRCALSAPETVKRFVCM